MMRTTARTPVSVTRGRVKPSTLPRSAQRAISRGVTPTKGGDGGRAVDPAMLHDGSLVHDRDNARRVLVCAGDTPAGSRCHGLVETSDPCDVAHLQRDSTDKRYLQQLVKAGRGRTAPRPGLAGCPPRLYPLSQTVGVGDRRVAFDSMFDGLHERRMRLVRDGVELYTPASAIVAERSLNRLDASISGAQRLRDVLHQRTFHEHMTDEEIELERKASRLLRRAKLGGSET